MCNREYHGYQVSTIDFSMYAILTIACRYTSWGNSLKYWRHVSVKKNDRLKRPKSVCLRDFREWRTNCLQTKFLVPKITITSPDVGYGDKHLFLLPESNTTYILELYEKIIYFKCFLHLSSNEVRGGFLRISLIYFLNKKTTYRFGTAGNQTRSWLCHVRL